MKTIIAILTIYIVSFANDPFEGNFIPEEVMQLEFEERCFEVGGVIIEPDGFCDMQYSRLTPAWEDFNVSK